MKEELKKSAFIGVAKTYTAICASEQRMIKEMK
jgi:hypothetical protein